MYCIERINFFFEIACSEFAIADDIEVVQKAREENCDPGIGILDVYWLSKSFKNFLDFNYIIR